MTLLFFGTGAILSAAAGALYIAVPPPVSPAMQAFAVLACLMLAAVFAVGGALAGRIALTRVVLGASWTAVPSIFLASVAIGDGLRAPNLSFMAVLVCLVTVLVSLRHGLLLAAAGALGMLALAFAEFRQWLPGIEPALTAQLPVRLAMMVMLLVAALAAGMIITRLLGRSLDEALEREQRFRGLLRIAVDRYWETDAQLRLTQAFVQSRDGSVHVTPTLLGRAATELSGIGMDAAALAPVCLEMEARRPFSNRVVSHRARDGEVHHVSYSGEPKFDAAGTFQGYWGVGRDVTAEVRAQQALRASEARYHGLFSRSPAPLVLHRDGIVLDANEAAAKLFGHRDVQAMLGSALHHLDEPGDAAQHGASAAHESTLRAIDGRRLTVHVRVEAVETAHGPALLSMYHDVTAQTNAEAALRHNEALMSHLFSASPDVITLTDLSTGRYLMVNDSFCRISGFKREQVIGRTSNELGVWHSAQDRERLVQAIREQGSARDLSIRFVTAPGDVILMQCSAARFTLEGRDYLVMNARDASERDRTRLELEAILLRASIGIAFTRGGRFVQANARFEEMFGWPAGELAGQPGSAVWLDDADYEEVGRLARPLLSAGKPLELERTVRRRDGSRFLCRLLAQVVDHRDPVAGGTVWIAEDVTERRRAEQALALARDEAEAANRAKTAFLANTSHEIRTPLNGILGMAELAMQDGLDETRRRTYLRQVHDSAQNLVGIISDILDLSKVEAGKLALEVLPFDLHDLLRSLHRSYAALADAKGLAFELDIGEGVPVTVSGDATRVRQIVGNLITNALKFTERGQVRIEAHSLDEGRVRLAVRDTGVGLDEEMTAQLFVPFSQGDQSITRRYGGTGLGLSICRELAQLMDGRVGVQSRLGQGSLFFADVRLPPAQAAPMAADMADEATPCLQGARVLLAEDNPVNMVIGVALLEQWGVEVTQAVDGEEAVRAVDAADTAGRPFDLVLMDVQMPRLSGYAAARRLRQNHDAQQLPIVALTAAALVSEREEAKASGMNDFLTKPVAAPRLRQVLAAHLRNRATRTTVDGTPLH